MPIRQFLILLGLFVICLATIGIAWATGNELYLWWMPLRHWFPYLPPPEPPTHPLVFLLAFGVVGVWQCLVGRGARVGLCIITGFLILGSVIGWFAYHWTPTVCQCLLTVAIVALTIYYGKQIDYIED